MNIIDALVVTLGLDSKDLESKTPRAVSQLDKLEKKGDKTEKSVAKIGKTTKETSRSLEGLAHTLTGVLAIIGGTVAVKAFVRDFINSSAAIERFSKNLGLSVSTVSAWGAASERFGGSAQALQGTFAMLSKEQSNLLNKGESGLIPYFSMMGIAMADVSGKARPVTDLMSDMNKWAQGKDRTTAHNIFAQMGIDEGGIILLLKVRKEFELEIERQKEWGATIAKFAPYATRFQNFLFDIKQKFTELGLALLQDASPALEKIFILFNEFGDWAQGHQQFIEDFLKVMAVGLTAIALITAPFNLTVAAVAALGTGISLLWDDYQTWAKGGKSAFDWGDFAEGIQTAADAIKSAYQWWTKWMNRGHENDKNWMGIPENKNKGTVIDPITKQRMPLSKAIATQEGFYASGKTKNRAQRNHNPGDLEYTPFAIRHGAVGSDGRFAIFPSDTMGMTALDALLKSPSYAGLSTEDTIKKFAPEKENDTAKYIANVKGMMGESGRSEGFAAALAGIPGAASHVTNAPTGSSSSSTSVDRSVRTDIGTLTINTQATDATGIAKDMHRALNYQYPAQANYGMVP